MSDENNLGEPEKEETEEKSFQKGWNNFISGIKGGFDKFQKSLENQSKKNKETWEENKGNISTFFKDAKQDWDAKIKEWNADMEKRKIETEEQMEVHKKKISQDFKNWQDKTKQNWEDGVSSFRKGFLKAYLWILLLIIPILIIVVAVFAVITNLMN